MRQGGSPPPPGFVAILNVIERATPADKAVHAIIDTYASHEHAKVRDGLARRRRLTSHFTLTSSSWLSAVEGFFAKLS